MSEALTVLLVGLEADGASVIVVDMVEQGLDQATQEAQEASQAVLNGARSVDLKPTTAYGRRLQHQLVRQANLISHSYGREPQRRVRIFRD